MVGVLVFILMKNVPMNQIVLLVNIARIMHVIQFLMNTMTIQNV
jgi:hypothetical protein